MKSLRTTYCSFVWPFTIGLASIFAATVRADQNLAGNVTVTGGSATGNLNVTGVIDSDGNQFTFGTQGASYGAGFFYNNDSLPGGSVDTFKFLLNRSPAASWLWVTGTTPVNVMRLDGNHQLTLFQSDGTTAGVTLTPASNQISLGTATLTASGTALTTNGALTVGGNITGSSTGLTLSPGGTNQNILLLNGTGKVGIGTSGPGYKLDVRTPGVTATQVHVASTDTDAGGYLTSAADQNMYMTAGAAYNGTAWIAKSTSFGMVGSNTGYINFWTGTGTTVGATLTNTAYERMRITATGNVGIGTGATTPAGMLQVTGTVLLDSNATGLTSGFNGEFGNPAVVGSGGFRVDKNSVTNGDKVFSSYHANSGNEFYHQVLSATSSQYIFNGGNVGIGTASPGAKLEAYAPSAEAIRIRGDSSYLALFNTAGTRQGYLQGSAGNTILASDSGVLAFNANGSERMRIDQAGNVGIGTSSPSGFGKFAVVGSIVSVSPDNAHVEWTTMDNTGHGILAAYSGTGANIGFNTTNASGVSAEQMRIDPNGNVGIGTIAPGVKLDVAGPVRSTAGTIDVRLQAGASGAAGVGSFSNDPLLLISGGTEKMRIATSGAVGIGTQAPVTTLQVNGTVLLGSNAAVQTPGFNGEFGDPSVGGSGGFRVNKNSGTNGDKIFSSYHANSGHEFYHQVLSLNSSQFVFLGGNVGVGTTSPAASLDVGSWASSGALTTVLARQGEGATTGSGTFLGVRAWGTQPSAYNGKMFSIENTFYGFLNSSIEFYRGGNTTGGYTTFTTGDGTERVRIDPIGNVGIGTTNPTQKLSVAGTIRAYAVVVDTGWSDYVFDENYRLAPLSEVEQTIKAQKHLPGIPSAQDVAEHGVSVGDMESKLLAKVEELTLHLIAQEKQLTAQQDEMKAQATRIEALEQENHRLLLQP